MASLHLTCATAAKLNQPRSSSRPPFAKPSHFITHPKRTNHRLQPSCTATNGNENQNCKNAQTRREVLIGLGSGGLYGAANLASNPLSLADPIPAPDMAKCDLATNEFNQEKVKCCPPVTDNIIDYKLPPFNVKRFRPAAHMVTPEYLFKYKTAIDRMRRLPKDDPRNFMQQANVHCAYCNGAYEYPYGPDKMEIQVHKSWLFFPFHRWYLYFHERILGSLINDPTFGLPYWNFDGSPSGMTIPPMYLEQKSPIYDDTRNPNHLGSIVDLAYNGTDRDNVTPVQNWSIMKNEMIEHANSIESFMGLPYRKGCHTNPGEGTVERGLHTALHRWGGGIPDPPERTGENLGNFYSAGRDPLFYALHANVDRLWTLWRDARGNKKKDFDDRDYLNTEFLFYDENKQLVRVRVADCLEQDKMGYRFQTEGVDIPWMARPYPYKPMRPEPRKKLMVAGTSAAPRVDTIHFPLKLDKVAKFLVQRPKKSRTQDEKETEEEILEILVEVDTGEFAKFDVFVDDEDENVEKLNRDEYAGTFAQIPQSRKGPSNVRTSIRIELTKQLENLNVEDDEAILVALVPRAGDVNIGGIRVIYSPS